jgi:hypothetical protein
MKLEATPVGESSPGMSQILNQLTNLSLQVEDMKEDKGKEKREDIWCIRCKSKGHDKEHCPLFNEYFPSGAPNPLKQAIVPWCEVCRTRHRLGECYYIQKYVQTPTNIYCTFCKSVGLMTSCMKGQGIHIEFKENYNKKGMLHSSTPQEEETSILVVGLEEEDEEEAWVYVEARLFAITVPS